MSKDNYKKVSVGGDITFMKPKNMEEGEEIIGRFTGELENDYGKTFLIETADGTVGINSTRALGDRMALINKGSEIKIVYLGRETNPKTKREFHAFDVLVKE